MLDDKEMCLLLIRDPQKGIERIMKQYMALVHTVIFGKLSGICNKQDIEECVSDVFYELYKNRNIINLEKGSLKSFLAVLSKRKAIDLYRKQRSNRFELSIDESGYDWPATDGDPEKAVINNETSDLLIYRIRELGEPDSQIMIRKYYFGQSTKVISKVLGLKENTVDKKVSRSLVKLKKSLGGIL